MSTAILLPSERGFLPLRYPARLRGAIVGPVCNNAARIHHAMTKLKLETFLPYRLNRISAAVSQQFRSIYGPDFDLSVPEWRVLATLGQFEVATAKAIGAHSAMHKTKVSRAVKALEDRRWLRRRQSEEDRREELLQLTDLGRGIYLRIVPRAEAFEKRLLASLGDDAGAFLRGLEMIEEQRLDGVPLDSPDEGGQT